MGCQVDECYGPVVARGWCDKHYCRWKRTGSTEDPPPRTRGRCTVDNCDGRLEGHGYCKLHYERWRRTGSAELAIRVTRVCSVDGCGREMVAKELCDTHYRRLRNRGSSSIDEVARPAHECVICLGPAAQWAYDHLDPNVKRNGRGHEFSLDPDHYMPMCIPCHIQFDNKYRSSNLTA